MVTWTFKKIIAMGIIEHNDNYDDFYEDGDDGNNLTVTKIVTWTSMKIMAMRKIDMTMVTTMTFIKMMAVRIIAQYIVITMTLGEYDFLMNYDDTVSVARLFNVSRISLVIVKWWRDVRSST